MALLTSTTLNLINQLKQYGVVVQLVNGELKVKLPESLTPEARPLLKELKKVITLGSFNQNEAYRLFEEASVRVSITFSPEAWNWVKANRPELVSTILTAEQAFNRAYRAQDMPGCREAVLKYERGFTELTRAYGQTLPTTFKGKNKEGIRC